VAALKSPKVIEPVATPPGHSKKLKPCWHPTLASLAYAGNGAKLRSKIDAALTNTLAIVAFEIIISS